MPVCGVHSKTHDGVQQHLKISRSHYDCSQCDKVYRKRHQLENHVRENHSNLVCLPCNRIFRSEISLQEHYRGSSAHPTCVICGKGFKDRRLYEEHVQETHSHTTVVQCAPCGDLELHKEELSKHYFESQNHPSCQTCRVGFLNDHELDEHSRMLHYETRCDQCQRQYDSMSDLQQHYLVSLKHPKCLTCRLGFSTETEEEKHHCPARSPASIKQVVDNNVLTSTPSNKSPKFGSSPRSESPTHNLSSGYSRRREKVNESTWSSLVFSEDALPSLTTGSSESSFILAKEKWHAPEGSVLFNVDSTLDNCPSPITTIVSSGMSDLISERALQPFQPFWPVNLPSPSSRELSSPEVQSPIGLEPLPSISPAISTPVSQSTIAPAPKDPWSQWRRPIEMRPSLPRITTGIRLSEESAPIDNLRSSVSTSLDRDIVRHGFHKTHDYLLNLQVPDLSSPLQKTKVLQSKAVANLGVLYERECVRNDDAYPFQYDTFQEDTCQEDTFQELTSTPNSGSAKNDDRFSVTESSILSATTVSSASLHCRLCMRNPSVDTTATMCGHIFCGKCIADSVIVSPKCPVCQNALLLYCLFKLDLTT